MSWPMVRLGECVSKVDTWNPIKSDACDSFQYIDLSSVDKDKKQIDHSNVSVIEPHCAPSRARQIVKTGDVLVSTVRPNLNGVALVTETFNGATASTGYCVLRSKAEKLDSSYLFYWVQTDCFISDMVKKATGATYPAVSDKTIFDSEIPLPPLAEQKRIADILDKADAIRRKRNQSIQLADDLLRSIFMDMFGDPVTNPKGWDIRPLGELCKKITDGEHGTVKRLESGRLYLMARNINRSGKLDLNDVSYISEEDHKRIFKRCGPEKGDVLLVCVGATIGKALIVPDLPEFSLARSVALLKPGKNITSEYLLALINTNALQNQFVSSGNSSAQAGLYLGKIKEILVPVPNLALQFQFKKIVEYVRSNFTKRLDDNRLDEEFFLSLNQKVFSGQL